MPDDITTRSPHTVQRGSPGRFPGGSPRGAFPRARYPHRIPVRRRVPFPIIFPMFFGFPYDRCYYIDRFGRCCDRFGRCCDRFGRCYYGGYDSVSAAGGDDIWFGMPGGWDMMPDMDDMYDVYDDMDGD